MKMSYNGTDNGYAIFRHVRIPRTNMLMRHSTVLRDGTYTSIPLRQKLLFGGMLTGRLHIVRSAASQFAQALTICARYSVVRTQGRQFASSPSTSTSSCHVEQSIISYQHQKHRLLTLISRCYITVFAHHHASSLFAFLAAQQTRNDHTMLPFLHVLLCGLKAWSTDTAANGAEDARKMCGGHGCMAMSGMPDIVDRLTTMCTFEGENFVMWAQVARYLMKALDTPEFPEEMSYMSSSSSFPTTCSAAGEDISKHDVLMEIFQHRATRLAREAHELVQEAQRRSKSRAEAENIHSLPLLVAARAHIEVLVLSFSIEAFSHFLSSAPQSLVAVISRLISLFGLTTIASPLAPFTGSFLGDDYLSSSQLADMQAQIDALLEKLGPDVIALTDAWMFTDASLASAIGCADGDIYARMMAWTRQLPINVDAARNGGIWEEGKGELSSFWGRNMKRASKL
jgi:acyl-CoA oxidase